MLASAEASSNLARYDGMQYGERVLPPSDAEGITSVADVYALTRTEHFGKEVKRRILLGCYALMAEYVEGLLARCKLGIDGHLYYRAFDNYYLQAQRLRNMVRDDFDAVFTSPNPLRQDSESSHVPSNLPFPRDVPKVDFVLHPTSIRTAPTLKEATSPSSASSLSSYVQDVLTVPASLAGLPALNIPIRNEGGDGWPLGMTVVGQWGRDRAVMRFAQAISSLR